MDTIVRLKSIDQWYQVVVEFENGEKKEKVYHVLERFYKNKDWKFIKFNLWVSSICEHGSIDWKNKFRTIILCLYYLDSDLFVCLFS